MLGTPECLWRFRFRYFASILFWHIGGMIDRAGCF
jgi:hypothetical protein